MRGFFNVDKGLTCQTNSQNIKIYWLKVKPLRQYDKGAFILASVRFRKCSCNSVWCPTCFKRIRAPKMSARIRSMNWERVRFVTLTIDPSNYVTPLDCFEEIRRSKAIAQFIHNLKRVGDHKITDYVWFLEWHRNGFPHWHLFIETEKRGRFGMIGNIDLRHYWGRGAVREGFPRNKKHWNSLTGYFEKNGYFEKGKSHQGQLPEWALNYDKKIRRTGSARQEKIDEHPDRKSLKKAHEFTQGEVRESRKAKKKMDNVIQLQIQRVRGCSDEPVSPFRGYEIILNECGESTEIMVDEVGASGYMFVVDIPYRHMVHAYPNGKYRKGYGFVIEMGDADYDKFIRFFGSLAVRENEVPF